MKKLIAMLLAAVMLLSMAACGAPTPAETTAAAAEAATEATTEETTEATTEATTEPETDPTTEPTEPIPAPFITKNPTDEHRFEGENAYFVAKAENYNYVKWTAFSPDLGTAFDADELSWHFQGLSVDGMHGPTLSLYNLPMELNGWSFVATFVGDGGYVDTMPAYVTVQEHPRQQLWANPSGGYFHATELPVTLTSNPGDLIHYDIYTDLHGGEQRYACQEVSSGSTIWLPVEQMLRYNIRLEAYVVGDRDNCITCWYNIDNVVLPPETEPVPEPEPEPSSHVTHATGLILH